MIFSLMRENILIYFIKKLIYKISVINSSIGRVFITKDIQFFTH